MAQKKRELDKPVKFEAEAVVLWEKLKDKKVVWDEQPLKKPLELKGGKLKGQTVEKLHKRQLMLLITPPAGLKTKFSAPYIEAIQAKFEDDKKKEGKVAFMSITKEFADDSDQAFTGKDVLINYRIVPSEYKGKPNVFLNIQDIEVIESDEDSE